ncbi:MAG: PQQ-dependent sugar dehydrogenase [Alphaproteobacteria bacterium]|nr:PQQ-dependent sugar dehydrogenase [Alphaproteobacteria bacterium]
MPLQKSLLSGLALSAAFLALALEPAPAQTFAVTSDKGARIQAQTIASFEQPWAMTFLPDRALLVTTRPGRLFLLTPAGERSEIRLPWRVAFGGQGGMGDVVLHPGFARNGLVYFSFAEQASGGNTTGAVVRARLERRENGGTLVDVRRIWTQRPAVSGGGHYSHRLAFGPDGKLFITAGDRQKLTPAQDFAQALGKIIRLNDDGSTPADNPFHDRGELARSFWTRGHRNPLGIAFDASGRLWAHEMGPRHGDELNLIVKGANYGWPLVSQGRHYSGQSIPAHATRTDFAPPKAHWVPAISPAGLVIYSGELFKGWKGSALIGGLSSQALVRVTLEGGNAREAERFSWSRRVREVEQSADGAIYVLEDGSNGRLLKLTP